MIKLVDIAEVPEKIGEAEIVFEGWKSDSYSRNRQFLPRRQSRTIVLPDEPDTKFYWVMNDKQFLFTSGEENNRKLFFGGMDESPFLVELNFSMIENLIDGSEAFFQALKPKRVKNWEEALKTKAKRQGDFFAIPFFKTDWGAFLKQHLGKKGSVEMRIADEMPLNGTRHRLNGLVAIGEGNLVLGDGVINAPDHEPLLLDGPHLIEQAVGFLRPQEAD